MGGEQGLLGVRGEPWVSGERPWTSWLEPWAGLETMELHLLCTVTWLKPSRLG